MKIIVWVFVLFVSAFFSCSRKNMISSTENKNEKIVWYNHGEKVNTEVNILSKGLYASTNFITPGTDCIIRDLPKYISSPVTFDQPISVKDKPEKIKKKKIKLKDIKAMVTALKTQTDGNRQIPKSAIVSFILGFTAFFPYLGILSAIAAIIFGIVALVKIHNNKALFKGQGYAISGIACSVFVLLLYAAFIYLLLLYNGY